MAKNKTTEMVQDVQKANEVVETAQEMAERLQKEVDAYKEEVGKVMDQETLDTMEKEIMAKMDDYDKYIKDVEYDLPESVVFEGKEYARKDIASAIIYFISNIEQTWQYVMGLYELCKLWKSDIKKISFGALDSTLRLLDQQKFKGMKEWRDILMINEYMKALHEAYVKDTTRQIALAQMHNEIIKRRDLIDPVKPSESKE